MIFFFFNDTATTEIYTLSLHDALPISTGAPVKLAYLLGLRPLPPRRDHLAESMHLQNALRRQVGDIAEIDRHPPEDRKSTRLNSSHANISYAVFCLKKKTKITVQTNHL